MQYADLLKQLRRLTPTANDDFGAQLVSIYLEARKLSRDPELNHIPLESLTTKRVSNDLNRLHRMQLLKRKRVKRRTVTKKGKVCYRGYSYQYSFSKQGLSYSKYLEQPWSIRVLGHETTRKWDFFRDPDNLPVIAHLKNISSDSQEYALKLYDGLLSQNPDRRLKGRYNRFPPKVDYPLALRAIHQNNDSRELLKSVSEKLKKGVAIKEKLEESAQTMLDIMEDGLWLLILAWFRFSEKDFDPAIHADRVFIQSSRNITTQSITFLLPALEWIIRELNSQDTKKTLVK